MTTQRTSRVDLHCHSTASEVSRLGVQRALGLPECATPPEEVLELALARGMGFVTITDHDTIDGALRIADDPRVFVSVELTARFRDEPQAVHVLCYGITPDDLGHLLERAVDVELVAEYLHEHELTCALAHPFYAVAAPLTPRHRRRLAQLFGVWEVRNGARARELNLPAATYIETQGGTGVGGSDDHAGIDIGRTYTETPHAATAQELLSHIRRGAATAGGAQGSAAAWAHSAMALTARVLLGDGGMRARTTSPPSAAAVLTMVRRVMREGHARTGADGDDVGPDDARDLLAAWLRAVDLEIDEGELLAMLQAPGFRHADLERWARRHHERRLATATARVVRALRPDTADAPVAGLPALAEELLEACVAALPYAPAAAFLGREKGRLVAADGEAPRVALVADGVSAMHGVTHTLHELRARGVPGFDVDVVATDLIADRRLGAVAEVELPSYPGLQVGVPSIPAIVEALAEGRYDLVHVCSPGPAGIAALLIAGMLDLPVVASHHTELAAYAALRTGDPHAEALVRAALGAFYAPCAVLLSPSEAADAALAELGVQAERIGRWDRGVDTGRFTPDRRSAGRFGDRFAVLYAGRLAHEKGMALLAESFLAAREREPRLHLVLAGGGPEEGVLRDRLGEHATFLGWQEGDELARTYASADAFLFASETDTFGQVLLEAQASGLPVVAVDRGGPRCIVQDDVTGLLCRPEPDALADAVVRLVHDPGERRRLGEGGRRASGERSWQRSLEQLAVGYRRALARAASEATRRAA